MAHAKPAKRAKRVGGEVEQQFVKKGSGVFSPDLCKMQRMELVAKILIRLKQEAAEVFLR